MARQNIEGGTQHHLGATGWPAAFLLNHLQPLQMTADINQHTRQFRTDTVQRPVKALPRIENRVAEIRPAAGRSPGGPVVDGRA